MFHQFWTLPFSDRSPWSWKWLQYGNRLFVVEGEKVLFMSHFRALCTRHRNRINLPRMVTFRMCLWSHYWLSNLTYKGWMLWPGIGHAGREFIEKPLRTDQVPPFGTSIKLLEIILILRINIQSQLMFDDMHELKQFFAVPINKRQFFYRIYSWFKANQLPNWTKDN